jgi:hypothetical protein
MRMPERDRHQDVCRHLDLGAPQLDLPSTAQHIGRTVRIEGPPRIGDVDATLACEVFHLSAGLQRRVVVGMALGRQSTSLDRVGEHHAGAMTVDRVEGVDQQSEVMATEVPHGGGQLLVDHPVHQRVQGF